MPSPYEVKILEFPESGPSLAFERFLFNDIRHLHTQVQPGDRILTFLLLKDHVAYARIPVFCVDTKAVSPRRATFGGIEATPDLPADALDLFLTTLLQTLQSNGIREFVIKSYPDGISPALASALHPVYLRYGFSVETTELNQHIDVTDAPLETRMHSSTIRRLKKSVREGFVFEEWMQPNWPEVHAFIAAARIRKNRPMTMTLDTLLHSVSQLPDVFRVFTVRQYGMLAALTVTVRINERILYTLYPADTPEFLTSSPLVGVYTGMYDVCQQEGYDVLDLGISTENGERNEGLIRFKSNLGALESEKRTYVLRFPEK